MCMLFVCVNPDADVDELALVVASIRDEYLHRPTRLASFWPENPQIIGGMDLDSGREGGTWMAMNRNGQIGALLNVLQPVKKVAHGKRNRGTKWVIENSDCNPDEGFLVPEFLQSNQTGSSFLNSQTMRSSDYAAYLMVTLDFQLESRNTVVSYLENSVPGGPVERRPSGMETFAFGNNRTDRPWVKTQAAGKRFEETTKANLKYRRRKSLVTQVFEIMNDDTSYFPDEQLMSDGEGYDRSFLQALSSIRVRIPFIGFGTRTQTVITISSRGKVWFEERTILHMDPVLDQERKTWPRRVFQFNVNDSNQRLPFYSMRSRL